jgi:hypothetical protein
VVSAWPTCQAPKYLQGLFTNNKNIEGVNCKIKKEIRLASVPPLPVHRREAPGGPPSSASPASPPAPPPTSFVAPRCTEAVPFLAGSRHGISRRGQARRVPRRGARPRRRCLPGCPQARRGRTRGLQQREGGLQWRPHIRARCGRGCPRARSRHGRRFPHVGVEETTWMIRVLSLVLARKSATWCWRGSRRRPGRTRRTASSSPEQSRAKTRETDGDDSSCGEVEEDETLGGEMSATAPWDTSGLPRLQARRRGRGPAHRTNAAVVVEAAPGARAAARRRRRGLGASSMNCGGLRPMREAGAGRRRPGRCRAREGE